MTYECFRFSLDGGLAHITFTQAERGNPFDSRSMRELRSIAAACIASGKVRAILLDAEGKYFSVGGDLRALTADREALPAFVSSTVDAINAALLDFRRLDAPMVAAVQGTAAGGAIGLLSSCDFVLSVPDARFAAAFAAIGIVCDSSCSYFLPRRVGYRRAREFLLLNETWTAGEAEARGLVDRICPADTLAADARALARQLAAGPTRAYGEIRRLLDFSLTSTLEQQLAAEKAALMRVTQTEDAWSAMQAVLAKRATTFEGR